MATKFTRLEAPLGKESWFLRAWRLLGELTDAVRSIQEGTTATVASSGAATQIIETGGPTTLDIHAVASGQLFQRSGTTVVGISRSGVDSTALHSGDSAPPSGSAGGDLGGTYPNPTVTQARGLRETSGPTTLTVGSISDFQLVQRSGSTAIGIARAGVDSSAIHSGDSAGGDLSGTLPNPTVAKVNGKTAGSWTDQQLLYYNSGDTTIKSVAKAGVDSTAVHTGDAAGGNLSGTYPNPTVAKVNGTSVPATPAVGQIIKATSTTAATWQTEGGLFGQGGDIGFYSVDFGSPAETFGTFAAANSLLRLHHVIQPCRGVSRGTLGAFIFDAGTYFCYFAPDLRATSNTSAIVDFAWCRNADFSTAKNTNGVTGYAVTTAGTVAKSQAGAPIKIAPTAQTTLYLVATAVTAATWNLQATSSLFIWRSG